MNGLTPHSTYTQQKQTLRLVISDTVTEMPMTISDLISEYAVLDPALATRKIRLDETGAPVNDEENNLTIAAQKEVLMSHNCSPDLKLRILEHISGNPLQIRVFNQICAEILESGYKANIDNLNLGRLRLWNLNWTAISSQNVHFDLRFRRQTNQFDVDLSDSIIEGGRYFSDLILEEYEQTVHALESDLQG